MAKKRRSAFSLATVIEPAEKKPVMDAQKSGKKKKRKGNKVESEPHVETPFDVSDEKTAMANIFKALAKKDPSTIQESIFPDEMQIEPTSIHEGDPVEEDPNETPKMKQQRPPIMPIPTSVSDSLGDSARTFRWMIWPMDVEDFMGDYWEREAVLIKRDTEDYHKGLFSMKQLAEIIQNNPVQFGVNIDIATWNIKEGRQTHNEPGRAWPSKVWDFYKNGCSVRLLNPNTYSNSVWKLCSGLQEFFGCFTGSNVYLTPPQSAGFAPHYDDVEVFMLQIEGRKRWKVWRPFENDELPRKSSRNYHPNEIKHEPHIYTILQPGDVLYVPRGWIHQGECLAGEHSLHVTISTHQKNAWCDLLEKIVPQALNRAIKEDVEFRRGLPTDYKLTMGVSNSDREDLTVERGQFTNTVISLMTKMIEYADVDGAVDEVAKNDIHCQLPPVLNKDEYQRTVGWGRPLVENGYVKNTGYKLDETNEIRLIRHQSARVILDEDARVTLCHNYDNPRLYKKEELKSLEITHECAAIFDVLSKNYPKYTKISELVDAEGDLDETLLSVLSLLENGVIMTKEVTKLYNEEDG